MFTLSLSLSLLSVQSSLSLGHLPRLFSTAMSCLLSPHPQVVSAATNTLKVRYFKLTTLFTPTLLSGPNCARVL